VIRLAVRRTMNAREKIAAANDEILQRAQGTAADPESPFEKWLFSSIEENWITPCKDALGDKLVGFCMFSPAIIIGFLFVSFIGLLSWCERRANAKARKKAD